MTNIQDVTKAAWPVAQTKEQILQDWLTASVTLSKAKAIEAALRTKVVEAYPFDAAVLEGTQRIPLQNGYELKVVKKQNYTLANGEGETDAALDRIEALGEREKLLAERLVKFKAEISVSEYKELPDNVKKIIDEVLTIKPGTPSLELIEPNTKK